MGPSFKIKLSSGRILGPLDLERVKALILSKHIVGNEQAREHPTGEWMPIQSVPALAALLLAYIEGKLDAQSAIRVDSPGDVHLGSTQILPGAQPTVSVAGTLPKIPEEGPTRTQADEDGGKTLVVTRDSLLGPSGPVELDAAPPQAQQESPLAHEVEEEKTRVVDSSVPLPVPSSGFEPMEPTPQRKISEEKTIWLEVPPDSTRAIQQPVDKKKEMKKWVQTGVVFGVLLLILEELFAPPVNQKDIRRGFIPIRPKLPSFVGANPDPGQSKALYSEGMKHYVQDTAIGYRNATSKFLQSATLDNTNTKALAMLASCYLNLIDSSNKDENYFTVITKLIEMSRAKDIDLPETVIADVEFFITVNRAEAAQNRIVEYTKIHQKFGVEMFYYLALAFYSRGDYKNAASYMSQIPDQKVFSAKIFYLHGQIAEKLSDFDSATNAFAKAVKFNSNHARSRLKLAQLADQRGALKQAQSHLEFIVSKPELLSPPELAEGYYLHAKLMNMLGKTEIALGDIEKSVKLDPNNHDYRLQLYLSRAKAGESVEKLRRQARMYFYLSEGEKLFREGNHQEALMSFIMAREANPDSTLPLVRIGDAFMYLRDLVNARMNYKKAAEKEQKNIEIWTKYIDVLIQSFEWEEAQIAMDRFKNLPVNQSAIDKAAGDMYAKQNRHTEAQTFYRKAMAREYIDPTVYISYAKSLMATKNFKDAIFFYALALRFDPLNIEALLGTSKAIAGAESIDRGISMLQDELQKGGNAQAEILCGMAELNIQKGEWDQAERNVKQALILNPNYAYSYKLQAQIFLNKNNTQEILERALLAYQTYSDMNPSDPSGYLERYKIFIRKGEYERAGEELNRIFGLYPKYPNLQYYRGALYGVMGNHKAAVEEFKKEMKNNPTNIPTMIALGKELIEIGEHREALELFNRAIQLAPRAAEPKHLAGYTNYLIKNYPAAMALLTAALAIDKGNSLIYKRLGMIYRDTGDARNAAFYFKKYLEMEPDAPDKSEYQRYL